jgi:hypothetical protein
MTQLESEFPQMIVNKEIKKKIAKLIYNSKRHKSKDLADLGTIKQPTPTE